ncbi:NXPE family member 3 [Strongylocentrotus purpuratus]|uniref:NXPE C-terminal domain-containing protein n=1 Tax=Strongylocentrotus purpuratus TaxID=7668 RepID=A0A7M7GQI7_STRPU|nr:NXPE family member 3 [Strongylocentrotus purpuratus]|eukprot:XP_003728164.1 PREDICTED: NXPE family member 3 [Strongylocentrotus purpuratus]
MAKRTRPILGFLMLLSAIAIIIMWWNDDIISMNRLAAVIPLSIKNGVISCNLDKTSPVEPETLQNHPLCPNRKRKHFPHFSYPPATPRQWITQMDTTNSTFSQFTIVNDTESYSVCDQLELLIEARNGYDEPKTYGGDLFRAKIFTRNASFSAGSGTDGEVIDLGNGKYSALFTLKWAGDVSINVILAVPSEAVFELQNLKETLQPRENYLGKFEKEIDGNNVEEDVLCGPVPERRLTSICNLSNPSVGLTWYCQKPKSSLLSCSDWTAFRTLEWPSNKRIEDEGYSRRSSVVHRPAVRIKGFPKHVIVNSKSGDFISEQVDRLPVCGQQHDSLQVIPWVAGFYQNKRWYPPTCKVNHFPSDGPERKNCLANKNVYFYGDSTIRIVHSNLIKSLFGANLTVGKEEHDIHLHYRFHHIPIRKFFWYKLSTLYFITNELDGIGSNETAIVVICLWAHFQPLYRSFYEQRIKSIADAALRLLNRNPTVVVMFKGGNTQTPYGPRVQYLNDHYARDNEEALRRILKSYPKIHFLDAWDMSKGQLGKPNTHPPKPHASNLVDQMLTIACPRDV